MNQHTDTAMLWANYHTHTPRCRHAQGTEREYIEAAIRAGIRTLGFSDHAPMLFDDGFVSDFRMLPEETEDYVRTLLQLKREYAGEIEILIGYDQNVITVANAVQASITSHLESMTGVKVAVVNVNVCGITR